MVSFLLLWSEIHFYCFFPYILGRNLIVQFCWGWPGCQPLHYQPDHVRTPSEEYSPCYWSITLHKENREPVVYIYVCIYIYIYIFFFDRGDISTATTLDFEEFRVYELIVEVTDSIEVSFNDIIIFLNLRSNHF